MTASLPAAPAEAAAAPGRQAILVDGHVHLYPCFPIGALFAAAYGNFLAAAGQLGATGFDGVLMLAESAGHDAFGALRRRREVEGWSLSPCDDALALRAVREGATLTVVAGRQVASADGVEVLALGADSTIPDGLSLERSLDLVAAAGAVPVLPWGVGKWLGRRGRAVAQAMWRPRAFRVLPGDIGGRPAALPTPPLLRRAVRAGITVVRGTDPLPLPSEFDRPGGFGLAFAGELDAARPATHLKTLLLAARPTPYGRLEGLLRFVGNQVRIRRR